MNNTKPIHLRSDEYNSFIDEYKEKLSPPTGELTAAEKNVIYRCGIDYGLTIDEKVGAQSSEVPPRDYNFILRIKGPYTLPEQIPYASEHGTLKIRPFVIHEKEAEIRMKEIAANLHKNNLVSCVVPIDEEYLYESLRETAFNISMEEVVKLGPGFQIIQVEFDENGHFKAVELDETHY